MASAQAEMESLAGWKRVRRKLGDMDTYQLPFASRSKTVHLVQNWSSTSRGPVVALPDWANAVPVHSVAHRARLNGCISRCGPGDLGHASQGLC